MGANSVPADATLDLDEQISQLMQCKPLSEQQVPLFPVKLDSFCSFLGWTFDSDIFFLSIWLCRNGMFFCGLKKGLFSVAVDDLSVCCLCQDRNFKVVERWSYHVQCCFVFNRSEHYARKLRRSWWMKATSRLVLYHTSLHDRNNSHVVYIV